MGVLGLSIKFEVDHFTINGDLSSDRNHRKHRDIQTESDTLLRILGRVKKKNLHPHAQTHMHKHTHTHTHTH